MRYELRYTWDAVNDLDSIFAYISDDNRSAATAILDRIEYTLLLLQDNPRIGAVLGASMELSDYRKIVVKPYIIFYRIDENILYVLRVLHNRQDWLHLLFESFGPDFLED